MSDPDYSFRFGRFTLEAGRGVLLGPGGEIPLRPKSYQILLYLVTHHGRLVGRNELLNAVWGRTAVTDDSLTQCLVQIRRALGDESRKMVRTVPRRGYLFDVPLAQMSPEPRATASRPATNGVAVLPFVDMSATQDQRYLGEGIAEEILNVLAQSTNLKVIARTSSFAFRDRPLDIRIIAGQLGVSYVLEGSVRRSGNRVRVIAQLIDALDGTHLWSEDFDRTLDETLDVQGEIAERVASALQTLLSGAPPRPEIQDLKAYEHFLRDRFAFQDVQRDTALAIVTHALSREAESRAAIERLRSRDSAAAAAALAEVYAQRGDADSAWRWLAESRRRIPPDADAEFDWLQQTSASAFLGPLHDDPRWAALFDDGSARISANAR